MFVNQYVLEIWQHKQWKSCSSSHLLISKSRSRDSQVQVLCEDGDCRLAS